MGSPELTRGSMNRSIVEEDVDANIDRLDGSESKRSVGDRYESRKRVSSANRGSSDDDYDGRNESRFKQSKKNTEGNTLDELSASYQDAEAEHNFADCGKPGNRGYNRAEERESKKPDPYNVTNVEKISNVDSRYSERWDSHRDKGSVYAGRERKRRWDESNETDKSVKRGEEFDARSGSISSTEKERRDNMENELRSNMGTKFHGREEMQVSPERSDRGDTWKINQDKEKRESVTAYENVRDWELPSRGRDSRSGWRKDGNRTEAVRTTSKYGRSNQNSDAIVIQSNPFDHDKGDGNITLPSEAKPSSDGEDLMYKEEKTQNAHGSAQSGEGSKDGVFNADDYQADRSRGPKGVVPNRGSGGSLTPQGSQEIYNRSSPFQGPARGNRAVRVGRGQPLSQQSGIPASMVASPFGPHGLPPSGPMQSLPPNMSPAPGQLMSPGIFIPPFQSPIMWPGARGVDMNMLGVPLGLPPVPPGPIGPRYPPNLVNPLAGVPSFNPPIPGGGILPGMMEPIYNGGALIHPQSQEKVSGGWIPPPRANAPPGKAPSRGEQNDYSQNFVDTGMRPQNYIRELELTSVVEDYPRLRELIQKKDEIVANSASPPMYYKCDLKEQELSPEFFGTKFDVILVDPPWEEYVHRAPGVTDHMEYWTFEEIMNLKIEAIADTPSFIFLCVGDGIGLEQGRQCLRKWGFRRCEDICWVKTNKTNATPGRRHDSHTLFQRSKEHYLMGIKGTVRRSTDGHIIHANIDTDVIIAEEPPYGSTAKPEDVYRIIEHFALGRRRLELFGEDHNIRAGWLTVGKGLSSSNFNREAYVRNFADKDGKVWVGGGGRNPPPEAPHLVRTTPEIESLRPKSPMKNQQQIAQQSASISLTTGNSSSRRLDGNMNGGNNVNQEASSSSNIIASSPSPWASEGREGAVANVPSVDMYGGGEFSDYQQQQQYNRGMNMF